jgi:beta-lactamase regulating signal transducer with metallopeptidase domain
MNAIGIALVWCVAQVTLIGLLAAGLYLVVRRLRPAAAMPVVFTGLAIVVALSLLVLSPWPRWTIHQISPLPLGEGQGVRAIGPDSLPLPNDFRSAPSEGREVKAGGNAPVPVTSHPSVAALLWQAFSDALANPRPVAPTDTWHWPAVVAVLFLTAMACGLGWLALGVLAVRRERLRSRPVSDRELLETVDVLQAELGCLRPIEIRQSDDLATAATIGWRRPVLLLPANWTTWTADQRRAILAHEIAHARSHDFLALLFGQLGLVLHFYHPLLHWLMNRLRLEQELAADAAAANISGGQWKYLTTIAELALHQQDRPLLWPARTFLPTRTTFLRRIATLRDSKLRFDRLSPAARLTSVGALLLCGLLVAGLRGPSDASPALAGDPAKPSAADASIDTTHLIEDASAIVVMRPAAIFARPELVAVAKLLEGSGNVVPKGTHMTDFQQITVVLPKAENISGLREVLVLQWVKPVADAYFAKQVADNGLAIKQFDGKKVFSRFDGRDVVMQYDDRTVIQAGSEQAMRAYFAGKRGVLPKWLPARAWDLFQRDQWVLAADAAMMHREMKGLLEHSPPVVQAAFASVAPVWQDTTALAAGARFDCGLAVHGWAETNNAEASKRLRRTVDALKTLAQSAVRNAAATLQSDEHPDGAILVALEMANDLLKNLKLQEVENDVRAETSVAYDAASVAALLSPLGEMRQRTSRMRSANNMKMIALAMHNYIQANRRFPPAVLYGPDGKTPYSWRVALLPYLEGGDVYKQYHFDEPWDGPNNRKLLAKMPAAFRGANEPAASKNASYFVLTGPGTMFDGREGTTFQQILDGTSNTMLAVEAKRDIPWTKPEDIPYDLGKPLPKLGGYFEGGFNAAMVDGSIHFLSSTASEKILRLLITKADRQPVDVHDAAQIAPIAPPPGLPAAPPGGRHTATAFLRMAMNESPGLSSVKSQGHERERFEVYRSTQQQLLLSRFVLRAALRSDEAAKLTSVQQATTRGDAAVWLMNRLQVSFPGNAAIMAVGISGDDAKEAAILVNAVVDTYLKDVVNVEHRHKLTALRDLDRDYVEKESEIRSKRAELRKSSEQVKAPDNAPPSPTLKLAIAKMQVDVKNLDNALAVIAKEREKLKAGVRAAPRVTLLQEAEVPEK